MKTNRYLALGLLLCLSGASVAAEDDSGMLNSAMTDPDFLMTAASSDEFERQSGQIAVERGQRDDVRTLGQRLIEDHTKSTQALAAAAEAAGLPMPAPVLHPGLERKLDELTSVPPELFDHLFLQIQAETHVDARALMRTCVEVCDAEPLRQTAAKILPVIRHHLAHTLELQRSIDENPTHNTGE